MIESNEEFSEVDMKNFKSYANESTEETKTATAEELAARLASAYHGKSNADIFKNILLEAEKSKRAGTLSNDELEVFYQTFSPMLDSTQRKRLRTVVDKLKEI